MCYTKRVAEATYQASRKGKFVVRLKKVLELEKIQQRARYSLYDHFDDAQIAALENFVRAIIELIDLEGTDARAIEGDDESEIRGY